MDSRSDHTGCLQVPAGIDAQKAAAIKISISNPFVFGFRLVMLVRAVLAVASAGFAWKTIKAPSRAHRAATDSVEK